MGYGQLALSTHLSVPEVVFNFNKLHLGILLALEMLEGGEKMAKILRCSDMGVKCDWVGRAATEEELLKLATKHAADEHGMKEIPKDLWAKAKAVIKEE